MYSLSDVVPLLESDGLDKELEPLEFPDLKSSVYAEGFAVVERTGVRVNAVVIHPSDFSSTKSLTYLLVWGDGGPFLWGAQLFQSDRVLPHHVVFLGGPHDSEAMTTRLTVRVGGSLGDHVQKVNQHLSRIIEVLGESNFKVMNECRGAGIHRRFVRPLHEGTLLALQEIGLVRESDGWCRLTSLGEYLMATQDEESDTATSSESRKLEPQT